MNFIPLTTDTRADHFSSRVGPIVTDAARVADELDATSAFPSEDMAALSRAGLLAAPLPSELGGVLTGNAEADGRWLLTLLHRLGSGNLAVGRIFEAHVNALRLILRYGTQSQKQEAAEDARGGKLFALWVTDKPGTGLTMRRGGATIALRHGKQFCSAAGFADRAVVTAASDDGHTRLLILTLHSGEVVRQSSLSMLGMRAATTGEVDFTGVQVDDTALLGEAGDYLREPEFSTGAWRSSAVALGGLAALLQAAREQLLARGRDGAPHQRARMGRAMIAHHTGWLWMERVAALAMSNTANPAEAVAYVNLGRTAVEAGCLDAMQSIQRSLGLAAFMRGNPVERICRDLSTYLRQPAPDEALDEAAGYFMSAPLPAEPS
jgi:alkylation response protein AidB-like acyl-CoA dehydrogenase